MKEYYKIIKKLKIIKDKGYIKTHRSGNTGIGKTIEDLLDIQENNIPGPNASFIELKSARKKATSMLTLFTKSPLPRSANSLLLQKYGYKSAKGNLKKELHTTVNAVRFNKLKGKFGFKIRVSNNKIVLINKKKQKLGYWDKKTLQKAFEKKLPKLFYIKAEARGKNSNEEFWFNEAWLLKSFDFNNFLKLLKKGVILVDIRIGQYPNSRTHDHGTAFRVIPGKLDLCFAHRKKVI